MIAMRKLSALWKSKAQYILNKNMRASGGLGIIRLTDGLLSPKNGGIMISETI